MTFTNNIIQKISDRGLTMIIKKFTAIFLILLAILVSSVFAEENTPIVLNDQRNYFINSNATRVKASPLENAKSLGALSLNDQVRVVNPTIIYNQMMVEIIIIKTFDEIKKADKYFLPISSLSEKYIDYKEFTGRYFVVVNIATEILRVYERKCQDNSCPHKMIMETEVVVGEDVDHPKEEKGKGRSVLGSYRITGWSKFYQDPEGHYPAWYRDGYPSVPSPDSSWRNWFSSEVMPLDVEGKPHGVMRGAFGWYTAFVEPNPYGQWTHGTLGWGSDKDKYIKKVKKPLINIVSDPRSSGCTRNNNEAIAFLRKILPVGSPIIKIYAKEEILDSELSRYKDGKKNWNYILTKTKDHSIDKDDVLKSLSISWSDVVALKDLNNPEGQILLDPKNPLNQILEIGQYQIDSHPDVIAYTPGEKLNKFSRKIGRTGNVYGIKEGDMYGVFYVDIGMLSNYKHPSAIVEASGFEDEMTPPWMKLSNTNGTNLDGTLSEK